jgi:hypothetical protein
MFQVHFVALRQINLVWVARCEKHMRAINLGSRLFSDVVASLYFTAPNGRVFSLVNIKLFLKERSWPGWRDLTRNRLGWLRITTYYISQDGRYPGMN